MGYFNADNKPDLVVTNQGSGNISVLLGNGTSINTFQPAVNYPTVPFAHNLGVAVSDVSRDGKQDLAVTNSGTFAGDYNVAILLGDGAGAFAPRVNVGGMPDPPRFAAVSDFNGDGKNDLVTATDPNGPGTATIFLNGCTASKLIYIPINPLPTLGNYPATGPINVGTGVTVTPTVSPSQSPTLGSVTASAPGFTGSFSVNKTTGVVTVSNAGPAGVHTVTVTATDNCGATATQTFNLTVNGPPTIMGKNISVVAGAGTSPLPSPARDGRSLTR